MPPRKVQLKRVLPDDISIIDDLELEPAELDFAGGPAHEISRRVDNDPQHHLLFLIHHCARTVGFLCLREEDARPSWASRDTVTLHNLRIDRSSRGSGLARVAIAASARWIAENRPGVLRLELSVNEENERAISLYYRCGFKPTGLLHAGRLGQEVIMGAAISGLVHSHSVC